MRLAALGDWSRCKPPKVELLIEIWMLLVQDMLIGDIFHKVMIVLCRDCLNV